MVTIGATWTQARAARRERPARVSVVRLMVAWLARVLPAWPRVRTTVMQLGAFGFLDYAAWHWKGAVLGCVAIGVSLFVLEALTGEPKRGGR